MKKRFLSLIIALLLMVTTISTVVMAAPTQSEVDTEIKATAQYLASNTPTSGITISSYNTVICFQIAGLSNVDAYVQAFIDSIKANNLTSEGKIQISGSESLLGYTYVLQVLARAGIDATNFEGYNLVANFETCLNAYDTTTLKALIDGAYMQYGLANLMYTVKGYSNLLNNSNAYMEMIKNIILSYYVVDSTYGYGFDIWGWGTYSSDDAGTVLVALKDFYNTDNEVKAKIDASMAYVKSLINPDGTVSTDLSFGFGDPDIRPSSSSTALALTFLSAFDDSTKDTVYSGLSIFKSTTTSGAFFGNPIDVDDDPGYSTKDALTGLINYGRMLSNSLTAFDITDTSVAIYPVVIQKINALPTTITINDKAVLDEITVLYNRLSEVFKAKITNYSNYQAALAAYETAYKDSIAPKTFDNSTIFLFSILMILSFSLFTFTIRKRVNE